MPSRWWIVALHSAALSALLAACSPRPPALPPAATAAATATRLTSTATALPTASRTPTAPPTETNTPTQTATSTTTPTPTPVPPSATPAADPTGQRIVFWHSMSTGRNLTGMRALVQVFNDGNPWGIHVEAHTPGGQSDLEQAMNAATSGGGPRPNVTMGFPNSLAAWHARGAIRPLNDLMAHPVLGLSAEAMGALAPAAFGGGTMAGGVQVGLPLHQSAQVLFYNHTWAQALGFAAPPATSAEFKQQACTAAAANNADASTANDGTGGYVYFPDASMVSPWIWAFDGSYVNSAGDGYTFDNPAVVDVALFFKDLHESGCTLTTRSFPNPEFARRQALFVTSSTAGILFQHSAMEDAGNDDVWGAIPYPGPNGTLVVNAFSHLLGVVPASPEAEMASWLFIRWLTSPEAQALWLDYTNYFPALAGPGASSRAQDDPIWAGALALLSLGKAEPNFPEHGAVRDAIRDAFFAILEAPDEAAVRAILAELEATAGALAAENR